MYKDNATKRDLLLQRLQEIEENIEEEIQKPFFSSGHAFVCFDSLASLRASIRHF